MEVKEVKLLADIFADPDMATSEEIKSELESIGFDSEEFRRNALNKIMNIKRENLYAKGKEKISKYKSLLAELKEVLQYGGTDMQLESKIRFAFNKLGGLDNVDLQEIMKDQRKLELIKKIKEAN